MRLAVWHSERSGVSRGVLAEGGSCLTRYHGDVDQWLQFASDNWWMIFPVGGLLIGLVSALGAGLEQAAQRRHTRRMEMLRMKTELKQQQAAARRRQVNAISKKWLGFTIPEPDDAPVHVGTPKEQLDRLCAAHDDVTRRWLEYELDVAKLIEYPAMSDARQPLTAAFLRAKKHADHLRPASPATELEPRDLSEYRAAVTDYEVAFDLAERDAKRLRDSEFSEVERKRLSTAQRLLTVAVDEAATPAERQIAYRRVREELDGLIALSDDATALLEERVALELPSGRGGSRRRAAPGREPRRLVPPGERGSARPVPESPPQVAGGDAGNGATRPGGKAPIWPVPSRPRGTEEH